jgi:hypothetical protein
LRVYHATGGAPRLPKRSSKLEPPNGSDIRWIMERTLALWPLWAWAAMVELPRARRVRVRLREQSERTRRGHTPVGRTKKTFSLSPPPPPRRFCHFQAPKCPFHVKELHLQTPQKWVNPLQFHAAIGPLLQDPRGSAGGARVAVCVEMPHRAVTHNGRTRPS